MATCVVCGEPPAGYLRSLAWRTCHAPIITDYAEPASRCGKTYCGRCFGHLPKHRSRAWFGGKRCVGNHEFASEPDDYFDRPPSFPG